MPQNGRSPLQRQRFMRTIKNDRGKKKLKTLNRFHSAYKINNYNLGAKWGRRKKKKKVKKNTKESTEQVKT